MLEALIRTKEFKSSEKKLGDVICVKLKEFADWGSMETRVHMVVDWEDPELEKRMRNYFESNGIFPVETTPYKIIEHCCLKDSGGNEIYNGPVIKTRSKKYFNIQEGCQKQKSSEQINLEFESNKFIKLKDVIKSKPKPERVLSALEIEQQILMKAAEKVENPEYIYKEIENKKQLLGGT